MEWQRGTLPLRWGNRVLLERVGREYADRILEHREDQTLLRPERAARLEGREPAERMLFGTVGMAASYQRAPSRGIRTTTYARSLT